jgi:hypothetical protein
MEVIPLTLERCHKGEGVRMREGERRKTLGSPTLHSQRKFSGKLASHQ